MSPARVMPRTTRRMANLRTWQGLSRRARGADKGQSATLTWYAATTAPRVLDEPIRTTFTGVSEALLAAARDKAARPVSGRHRSQGHQLVQPAGGRRELRSQRLRR